MKNRKNEMDCCQLGSHGGGYMPPPEVVGSPLNQDEGGLQATPNHLQGWRMATPHGLEPPVSFFNFFLNNIFNLIYLYLFIKSNTYCHFISTDVVPNGICQKISTKFLVYHRVLCIYFNITWNYL